MIYEIIGMSMRMAVYECLRNIEHKHAYRVVRFGT